MAMVYPSLEDVVEIHDAIVALMGGPPSPLLAAKRSDLDSAIARPRHLAFYERADLAEQAALAVGISQAQAFLDGNKRTAFGTADLFLRANGRAYSGPPMELALWIERVAEADGRARVAGAMVAWLRSHLTPAA